MQNYAQKPSWKTQLSPTHHLLNANSQKISETVNDFITEYNKSHGYNLIISKASLLFADEALNITAEVLEGLNAAYNQASK